MMCEFRLIRRVEEGKEKSKERRTEGGRKEVGLARAREREE